MEEWENKMSDFDMGDMAACVPFAIARQRWLLFKHDHDHSIA